MVIARVAFHEFKGTNFDDIEILAKLFGEIRNDSYYKSRIEPGTDIGDLISACQSVLNGHEVFNGRQFLGRGGIDSQDAALRIVLFANNFYKNRTEHVFVPGI